jgi:hypothetical protein
VLIELLQHRKNQEKNRDNHSQDSSARCFSVVCPGSLFLLALLRRSSTSHERAIQVGTPRRGSTQRISPMYTANNVTNQSQLLITSGLQSPRCAHAIAGASCRRFCNFPVKSYCDSHFRREGLGRQLCSPDWIFALRSLSTDTRFSAHARHDGQAFPLPLSKVVAVQT